MDKRMFVDSGHTAGSNSCSRHFHPEIPDAQGTQALCFPSNREIFKIDKPKCIPKIPPAIIKKEFRKAYIPRRLKRFRRIFIRYDKLELSFCPFKKIGKIALEKEGGICYTHDVVRKTLRHLI